MEPFWSVQLQPTEAQQMLQQCSKQWEVGVRRGSPMAMQGVSAPKRPGSLQELDAC